MSRPKQILIADDELNIRLTFSTALEVAGYRPSAAKDGEEALMWLQGSRPDLVLLDLRMPGVDGIEVLEALRCVGDDVPVVVVTARGSISDAVRAMQLGAVDFVEKPLGPATLRSMVADVLAREERRDRPAGHSPGESRARSASHPRTSEDAPAAIGPGPVRQAGAAPPIERNLAVMLGALMLAMLLAVMVQAARKGENQHVPLRPAAHGRSDDDAARKDRSPRAANAATDTESGR